MGIEQSKYDINPINSEEKLYALTQKPIPSDREVVWDKTKTLICKTDSKGIILYANEAFIDVCGYDDFELIAKNSNIIRHPDMPKVIFKIMWEIISVGDNFITMVINMAKTGRYYWVINEITPSLDKNGDYSYTSRQSSIRDEGKPLKKIITLYKKLLHIEQASGVVASENYLIGFLEERNKTFIEYIKGVLESAQMEELQITNQNVDIIENTVSEKVVSEKPKDVNANEVGSSDIIKIKKKGFFSSFFVDPKEE